MTNEDIDKIIVLLDYMKTICGGVYGNAPSQLKPLLPPDRRADPFGGVTYGEVAVACRALIRDLENARDILTAGATAKLDAAAESERDNTLIRERLGMPPATTEVDVDFIAF